MLFSLYTKRSRPVITLNRAELRLEYGGQEYDTHLITPNKLMMREGHHGIVLRKGDYKSKGKIDVIAGTERTYECTLNYFNR